MKTRVKRWSAAGHRQYRYKKAHPYARHLEYAKRRCKEGRPYLGDGSPGAVSCILTLDDVRALWHRDRASEMKKPSLDRIDAKKGYTFQNCRYLEFRWNARRAWDGGETDAALETRDEKALGRQLDEAMYADAVRDGYFDDEAPF